MAEPKKRTLRGVYDGLKQISDEEGIDFGIDNYTYEQFAHKYGNKNSLATLHKLLSTISDEEAVDFGIGSADEWLNSFNYNNAAQAVDWDSQTTAATQPTAQQPTQRKTRYDVAQEQYEQGRQQTNATPISQTAMGSVGGYGISPTGMPVRNTQGYPQANPQPKAPAKPMAPAPRAGQWSGAPMQQTPYAPTEEEGNLSFMPIEQGEDTRQAYAGRKQAKRDLWQQQSDNVESLLAASEKRDMEAGTKRTIFTDYGSEEVVTPKRSNETRELRAAQRALRNTQRIINAADNEAGFGQGLKERVFDLDNWDFGITDITDLNALKRAMDAFDKGEKLTESQRALLDAKALEMAVNVYFASDLSKGYQAGQDIAGSLPFMAEFMLGIGSAASKATSKALVKYFTKRFANAMEKKAVNTAVRGGAKVLSDLERAAIMTGTTGVVGTEADARQRMMGQVRYNEDEQGKVTYAGHTQGEDEWKARRKAATARTLTNFSEMFGEYLGFLGKGGRWLSGTKGGKFFGLDKVAGFIDNVATSEIGSFIGRIESKAQFHGAVGEMAEELFDGVTNATFVGDQTLQDVFDKENLTRTALSVGIMSMFFSGAKLGSYGVAKGFNAADMAVRTRRADRAAANAFGEQWDGVRGQLDQATAEEAADIIQGMYESGEYTDEQLQSALNYAIYKKGNEMIERYKANNQTPQEAAAEQSYNTGYEDANTDELRSGIEKAYTDARARLVEILEANDFDGEASVASIDENPTERQKELDNRQDVSDDIKYAIAEYVSAKSAWDGVQQRISDDAADRADQRRAEGEKMAYKGNGDMQGMLRPLTIKEESSERDPETGEKKNKTVYLVNGNIAIEPNGNGLSREGTDKTIYVYDPETGDTHELDPFGGAGVLSVGDVVSMEDYLTNNEQQSQAEVQQEIDNATGKVNVATNTPFVTPEGRQGIVQSIEGDNAIVLFADGEMEQASMPLAEVQQYADALRRKEYEARHPQQTPAEQPQQPNTATEGQNTVGAEVAAEYLLGSGANAINSTDYLIKALSGIFSKAQSSIEAIRQKYQQQFAQEPYAEIDNFVKSDLYEQIVGEVRNAINAAYGSNSIEAQSILDEILKSPKGLPNRTGQDISRRVESLNAEQTAPQEGNNADTRTPAQRTYDDVVAKLGADRASKKIDATAKVKADRLKKADKALKTAQETADNTEYGSKEEQKAEEAVVKAQAEYDAAQQDMAAWDEVRKLRDQALLAQAEQEEQQRKAERERRLAEETAEQKARREADEAEQARRKAEAEAAEKRRQEENERLKAKDERLAKEQQELEQYKAKWSNMPADVESIDKAIADVQGIIERVKSGDTKIGIFDAMPLDYYENELKDLQRYKELVQSMTPSPIEGTKGQASQLEIARQELADDPEALAILEDMEPLNLEEVAAKLLSSGKNQVRLQREDFLAHTGYSAEEAKRYPFIFASKEKGGVTMSRLGELIESEAANYGIMYDENDAMAGVNAALSMLGSVYSQGDINGYIASSRIEQAYDYHNAMLGAARANMLEAYGMTEGEYESYMSWLEDAIEQGKSTLSDEEFNQLFNVYEQGQTTDVAGGNQEGAETTERPESAETDTDQDGERGNGETDAGEQAAVETEGTAEGEKPTQTEEKTDAERNKTEEKALSQTEEKPFELTLEALEASDLDEVVKSGARAWLNGEHTAANQFAFLAAQDYVRSTHGNVERSGSDADTAQLGSTDNGVAPRDSGRGNGEGGQVDTGNNADGVSQLGTSREDSEGDVAGSDGGRGDNGLRGGTSVRGEGADSGRPVGGSGNRRSGGNGKPRGKRGGSSVSHGNESGDTHASAMDELDAAVKEFEDALKESVTAPLKGKLLSVDPISLYTFLGGVKAIKVLAAGAKVAYAAIKVGAYNFKEWVVVMKSKLGNVLRNIAGMNDEQIDGFIEMMWDYDLTVDGETHKVREWAAMMSEAELRKQMSMTIEEKRKLQQAAEKTPVVLGDITNIRENLPFLLPKQQEDVQKAERQFFDESHADAQHGHGKGYMFTNGTGTGKTYTGLGIVKRFLKQGKGRILIVTASETKINDWIRDAKNLGIEATMLPDTKSKGSGVVVTQFANMRQNRALLEDEFDLIVYDESHKLMENQNGAATSASIAHHMLSNRDVRQAARRTLMAGEFGAKIAAAREEYDMLFKLLNTPTTKWTDEMREAYRNAGGSKESVEQKLEQLRQDLEQKEEVIEGEVDEILSNPEEMEKATAAVGKTKVVFLSATPFNTPANLDYTEGYIFSYTNTDEVKKEVDRFRQRDNFLIEKFNSSHTRNPKSQSVARLPQERISDPQKASEEEVEFSDYLQGGLETMSGRDLDSEFDYSREFPKMDFKMADRFNDAIQSLSDGRFNVLREFFDDLLDNYNTMTGYLEIFKSQMIAPRIRQYIDLGKKVTLYHRRKASNVDMNPPFSFAMQKALRKANSGDGNPQIKQAIEGFIHTYRDLFDWESSIDYMFPQESILREFMTDAEKAAHEKAVSEWQTKYGNEISRLNDELQLLNLSIEAPDADIDKIMADIKQKQGEIEKMMRKYPKPKCAVVKVFNGTETQKDRDEAVKAFNDDNGTTKVLVVQVQSGKEGISLHDTTGKFPRVQIGIFLPQSPIEFIQTEGRIFRVGNKSNAIFEYPLLGLDIELSNFALKINGRSETTENLALGSRGRGLKESISRSALASRSIDPANVKGVGGKELDSKKAQQADEFDAAMKNYAEWRDETKPAEVNEVEVPDPIGYIMAKWGRAENGERVLVPNARRGSVARYVPSRCRLTAMEERNKEFARLTALIGGSGRKVLNEPFLGHSRQNKYDIIVMNTAHGDEKTLAQAVIGGNKSRDAIDVVEACRHLDYSGRIVALVSSDKVKEIREALGNGSFMPIAEIKMPDFVLNGTPSSVIVIDNIEKSDIRKTIGEMQVIDLSKAESEDRLFAQLRDVAVPERHIDNEGKIERRLRTMTTPFVNTGLVAKRKNYSTNKTEPDIQLRNGYFEVQFSRNKMVWIKAGGSAFTSFWIEYHNIAENNLQYIQNLAVQWVALDIQAKASDEELMAVVGRFVGRKADLLGGQRDCIRAMMQSIELALGKSPAQIRNIAEGKVENEVSGSYDLQRFREVFDGLNDKDAEIEALADKVFAAVSHIDGLQFKVVSGSAFGGKHNVVAHYVPSRNIIELNGDQFNSIRLQDAFKAQTIVHEMIHSLTCWALETYKNENTRGLLTPEQQQACKDIMDVYEQINTDEFRQQLRLNSKAEDNAEYGLTNEEEMVAELANPIFRAMLKAKKLWRQLINGIKMLLGIKIPGVEAEETDALTVLDNALETLMNTYDPELYKAYTQSGGIAERNMEIDSDVRFRGEEEPVFYSNAMRAVENIKQERATPEQWVKMIEKQGGMKAGEDKWLGLSEWLKGSEAKTLTKGEVLDYIRANEIQVEEVEYGMDEYIADKVRDRWDSIITEAEKKLKKDGYSDNEIGELDEGTWNNTIDEVIDDWFGKGWSEKIYYTLDGGVGLAVNHPQPINSTRLRYSTKGLNNKREIAFVVPTAERFEDDEIHFGELGGQAIMWVRFGETTDADGKRVLVIDEIQSKRHQEGREKGYKGMEVKRLEQEREKALENKASYAKQLRDKYGDNYLQEEWKKEETDKFNALQFEIDTANENLNKYEEENGYSYDKIPDAPFEKNWHEVAMKRMLRFAAENGYDKVAWTKGEQQAERYDLSKVIDEIAYWKDGEGIWGISAGDKEDSQKIDQQTFTEKELVETFGREIAERIINDKGVSESVLGYPDDPNVHYLNGETIKIGGEGMKGFYDQILPRFMDKYGKKWGVKTGEVELPNIGEGGLTMWSVDVTDDMRESVMRGQPLFRNLEESDNVVNNADAGTRPLTDREKIAKLESEPKVKVYRSMQLIDGKLYPPMSARVDGQLREPSEIGVWEEAEEHPELADENGKFKLDKGNKKSLKAAYNPYIHTSRTMLNDQFSEAQSRPNLVVVEVEIPESELNGTYRAEKAKDSVGAKQWKAGVIQGQLSGTREVILSRWAKPVRIVPDAEVAENIARQIEGQVSVMPSNVVTPQVRAELEKRGVRFVETDNTGRLTSGSRKGETWAQVYGKNATKQREGGEEAYAGEWYDRNSVERIGEFAGYTPKQIAKMNARQEESARKQFNETAEKLHLSDNITFADTIDDVPGLTDKQRREWRRKKGWYSPRTGKIVIILGNHKSMDDVMKSILHEGVAHHGLRQMFGEHFNTFLDNVYRVASPEIRDRINTMAKKHGWDFREATEEYLAMLAEDTDFERPENQSWWGKVKAWFFDMLHKIGFKLHDAYDTITDNELRYILWRSYENLVHPGRYNSVVEEAKDIAKQYDLKVGQWDENRADRKNREDRMGSDYNVAADGVAEDGVRFRDGEDEESDSEERESIEQLANDRSIGTSARFIAIAARNAQESHDNAEALAAALNFTSQNLAEIVKATKAQKKFDKATVKQVTDMARVMVSAGYLDSMGRADVKGLLKAIRESTGETDNTDNVNRIIDIMVKNQLKNQENTLATLLKIKGSRVDARGINVQGKLDPNGQQVIKSFKDNMKEQRETIESRIADAEERMTSEDRSIADAAYNEKVGLQLALDYVEKIGQSKADEKDIEAKKRAELSKVYDYTRVVDVDEQGNALFKKDGTERTHEVRHVRAEYKGKISDEKKAERERVEQTAAAMDDAIRHMRMERIDAYTDFIAQVAGNMKESMRKLEERREAEKRRIEEIHHNANSDMEGRPASEHRSDTGGVLNWINNTAGGTLFAPLASFGEMLRMFGRKSPNGEGYLFNRFMRGLIDARHKELNGVHDKYSELDKKAQAVFGGKVETWADMMNEVRKGENITVEWFDGKEMKPHTLHQGNLMYIYMVNKMSDGRMKLRHMGIDEKAMAVIESKLDPRLKEIADWLQEDFLVRSRNEYNETHKRMFGASMSAIEDYFPLVINSGSRNKDAEKEDAAENNPNTITTATGAIKKRTVNVVDLDLLNADAMHVILDHIAEMEHWNAFAEYNRDLNTLRSYKRFENQVKNMTTILGDGEQTWKAFNKTAQIAVGSYQKAQSDLDAKSLEFASKVTAAKVAFRINTALKQLLSLPAYLPYANASGFYHALANDLGNGTAPWKWCMENLPMYRERWESRVSGDPRLVKLTNDWNNKRHTTLRKIARAGMLPNAAVDALTVSIGAHAVYETRKAQYLKEGYSETAAEKRAIQDAEIAYNETQQSSEGGFVSVMQVDKSWLNVLFTIFRNASMAYQRQLHGALRNLINMRTKARREQAKEFLAKQIARDGVNEAQARLAAEKRFNRAMRKNWIAVATFGYIVQLAWNFGGQMWYLLFGDDDDKKKKTWKDILIHSLFGGVEGLTGGDWLSELGRQIATGDRNPQSLNKDMPLTSDMFAIIEKFGQSREWEAVSDIINLVAQAGFGANPQTLTDIVVATIDACNGDLGLAREAGLWAMRVIQVPQSQTEQIYFDEIGMTGDEARKLSYEQLVERYAKYRVKRNYFWTFWEWDNEKALEKGEKRGERIIKERMETMSDEQLEEALSNLFESSGEKGKKLSFNQYAKREGLKGYDYSDVTKNDGAKYYMNIATWRDMAEDITLHQETKRLEDEIKRLKKLGVRENEAVYWQTDDKLKDLNKAKKEIGEMKKEMVDANGNPMSEEIINSRMENIRKARRRALYPEQAANPTDNVEE